MAGFFKKKNNPKHVDNTIDYSEQNSMNNYYNNHESLNDIFNNLNHSLTDDAYRQEIIGDPSFDNSLTLKKVKEIIKEHSNIVSQQEINNIYEMALKSNWKEIDLINWLNTYSSKSINDFTNINKKIDNFIKNDNSNFEQYRSYSSIKDDLKTILIEENYRKLQFDHQTEVLKNHIDNKLTQFLILNTQIANSNNGGNLKLDSLLPYLLGNNNGNYIVPTKPNYDVVNQQQNIQEDNLDKEIEKSNKSFQKKRNSINNKFKEIDKMIQKSINELRDVEQYVSNKDEIESSIQKFKNI